jgi:hypothetical protein
MSFIVGPTTWWVRSKESVDYYARACPVGTVLQDCSAVWCKCGGLAWIVSPICTQIADQWASGQYNTTLVGSTRQPCCICEWPNVCSRLISCGFNPCDWFIPNNTILFNAYNCRAFLDTGGGNCYWSSSETTCCSACLVSLVLGQVCFANKCANWSVRAFRCVLT